MPICTGRPVGLSWIKASEGASQEEKAYQAATWERAEMDILSSETQLKLSQR
jgi:hypothetical protein